MTELRDGKMGLTGVTLIYSLTHYGKYVGSIYAYIAFAEECPDVDILLLLG